MSMSFQDFLAQWFDVDEASQALQVDIDRQTAEAEAALVTTIKETLQADRGFTRAVHDIRRRAFFSSELVTGLRLYRGGDQESARALFERLANGSHPVYAERARSYLRGLSDEQIVADIERLQKAIQSGLPPGPSNEFDSPIKRVREIFGGWAAHPHAASSVEPTAPEQRTAAPPVETASTAAAPTPAHTAAEQPPSDREPDTHRGTVGMSDWTAGWPERAACRTTDPDALFVQGAAQNRAKLVCMGCPVRTECLADALDNRVEFGVWGGMTERERRALLRRRPDVQSWRTLLEAARRLHTDATAASRGVASSH
jgi:WhiB family redox-sensing transcriptional regulator